MSSATSKPTTMEFSASLDKNLKAFGTKTMELEALALKIKKQLIREQFINADSTYPDVMQDPLLQETLLIKLSLSLDDSTGSVFGLTPFNVFTNGKNDNGLHKIIAAANLKLDLPDFQQLVSARNNLVRKMKRCRKNLIDFMSLDEAPSMATALLTKENVASSVASNTEQARTNASKRRVEELADGGNDKVVIGGNDTGVAEDDGLTELTENGENKKQKKGIEDFVADLITLFPVARTTGILLYVHDGDLLYDDKTLLPDNMSMYTTGPL